MQSFAAWGDVTIDGEWSNASDVKAFVTDCSGTQLVAPFTLSGGKFNLAQKGVTTANDCIRVGVELSKSGTSALAPRVTRVQVKWTPKAGFLIDARGEEVLAGADMDFKVRYSVSYADEPGVVVWLPVPAPTNYTAAYGQNPVLAFQSATAGGQYTATAVTVNGVGVPANSVYWDLGTVPAGTSQNLTARFATQNGWENGITYDAVAHIKSTGGGEKTDPATGKVKSAPSARATKTATNTIALASDPADYSHAYPLAPYNGVVDYHLSFSSGTGSYGIESLFNGYIEDDVTQIKALLASCGVADPFTKMASTTAGYTYSESGNTVKWVPTGDRTLDPGELWSVDLQVDYSDCFSGGALKAGVTPKAANNTVTGIADNGRASASYTVEPGGVVDVSGIFAVGDTVNGESDINAARDDIPADSDRTVSRGKTPYGATEDILLHASNDGRWVLNNLVMIAPVMPAFEFVSARLPAGVTGSVWYYTCTNYVPTGNEATEVAPPFTYGTGGTCWSQTPPSNPATVTWVAFTATCVASGLGATNSTPCANPSAITGTMTVVMPLKPALERPMQRPRAIQASHCQGPARAAKSPLSSAVMFRPRNAVP
jgi:hypothetical protein